MRQEYAFDVKIFATLRVKAESQEEARAALAAAIDGGEANFGSFPNGEPIIADVCIDGEIDLIEVDGKSA
ncbi:MAG: hypothetical protein P4M13_10720 [Alphaproteobacteria bacterium]|nr:hypothetical protein [Alphaproteobacteria bacterium]